MRRIVFFTGFFFFFALVIGVFFWRQESNKIIQTEIARRVATPTVQLATVPFNTPPPSYSIPQGRFVAQSFNNCGPAALSMIMSMFGTFVDQETLADRMRPYHNPAGGVDDKSIFAPEFVTYAKEHGFEALERPNGDMELLKTLIANDIPVVVRTWLHPNEDIGHFRIVRGYNDTTQTILQDDSYEGPNLSYSYDVFLSMWQPFNYGYILVYPKEKASVVEAILGEEMNATVSYEQSIERAEEEITANPEAVYPYFNIATALYHLKDYAGSVAHYERVARRLPSRMLWYQIEPIQAYQKNGERETVFQLTDSILNNGNLAYSELYQLRGEMYVQQGNIPAARAEFEKAVRYNANFLPAKESLATLE